jgi:arylsulfatase A-like enzyme
VIADVKSFHHLKLTGVAAAFLASPVFLHALEAPTEGIAVSAGAGAVAVSWTDSATVETGYEVEIDGTLSVELPANTTHYYDRGLSPQTTRSYRVRALGESENSGWLDLGSATTTIRMNVLFFLADDMGYKDIVALRNPEIDGPTIYETPTLDTLASQSVVFTNAYCSGPRCVVARRSMQTGMYDWRPEAVPNNQWYLDHSGSPIGGGLFAGGLSTNPSTNGQTIPDNVTYGEVAQEAGYRTCFIGKFHLGESPSDVPVPGVSFGDQPARGPDAQGYAVSIAAGHAGAPPESYFALENPAAPGTYSFFLPDCDSPDFMPTDPADFFYPLADTDGDGDVDANDPNPYLGDGAPYTGEYLTDRLTYKAIGFIDDTIANHPSQPFHLTLAHYAVHTPVEAKENDINYFTARKSALSSELATHPAGTGLQNDQGAFVRTVQDNRIYAAMMKSYDDSLAALRAYLAATDDPRYPGMKLSETTILVVSSDHGGKSTSPSGDNKPLENDATDAPSYDGSNTPYNNYPTSNYPYRFGKTWVYEGGLKIPLIVYYPGLTPAGGQADAIVHQADFWASFADMTGAPASVFDLPDFPDGSSQTLDSESFMLPAARPDRQARRESFHFFTNANIGTGNPALGAYRRGDYKLLYFMVQRKVELYNLAADLYEKNDLSETRPDLAGEMLDRLYREVLDTGFKMPQPGSNSWRSEQEVLVHNGLVPALPDPPDAAPSNLILTQLSETAIQLDWTVHAANATHSVIYRSGPEERAANGGSDSYREIAYVPAGQTTYVDTHFTSTVGEQYKYRVESENLGGWNGWTIDASGLFSDGTNNNGVTNTGNEILTLQADSPLSIQAADDSITTLPGEEREFAPLLNDRGEGILTIVSITQPNSGSARIEGNRLVYLAPAGFAGNGTTMTYTIEDEASQTDTATVTFTLPTSPAGETEIEDFTFDDDPNTDLNDLANTGTRASTWNFNTPSQTDGNGLFVITGDGGTTTRRLPAKGSPNALADDHIYAAPLTGGKYRLEVKFDSWDVDPASAGDEWTFNAGDATGTTIARIDFQIASGGVNFRFSGFDGNFREEGNYSLVQTAPVTAAIIFDFDNDSIEYLIDGTVLHTFAFTATEIGQLSYIKGPPGSGIWNTAATSISLDHLKLIQYEPAGTLFDAFSSAYPWNGILATEAQDDADGDGFNNLMEFALGTSPVSTNASLPVRVENGVHGPSLVFTPVRDTSAILYTIEFSTDLDAWDLIEPVEVTSGAGMTIEAELPSGGRGFGRVGVSE